MKAETDDDVEEVAAKQMPKGPNGKGKPGEKMAQPVTLTAAQPVKKKARKEEETVVCFYSAGETHFGVRSAEDVMHCTMEKHDHISVQRAARPTLDITANTLETSRCWSRKIFSRRRRAQFIGPLQTTKMIRVCVCYTKGRHRSVTLSKVLQEVRPLPFGVCYWCEKFKGHKKAKGAVFKKAALMW